MKEVLDRNYELARKRKLKELKRLKRQQKVESVLATIIGLFLIACTIYILSVQGENAVRDCMEAGNTRHYCEKGLL